MGKPTTKWKDRGFDDKQHYAGWLYFNDLTDDCKMYDDVYYDQYSGKMVNVASSEDIEEEWQGEDEADSFLAQFDNDKETDC